jgi:hypothetical protein
MCRALFGMRLPWRDYLTTTERKGYKSGDNVFGGGHFIIREWILAVRNLGGLQVPGRWHNMMQEDLYVSMVIVAARVRLRYFAVPDPLFMECRGLPLPAGTLDASKFKLVQSLDKGLNTGPAQSGRRTAREVFRDLGAKLESVVHGGRQ